MTPYARSSWSVQSLILPTTCMWVLGKKKALGTTCTADKSSSRVIPQRSPPRCSSAWQFHQTHHRSCPHHVAPWGSFLVKWSRASYALLPMCISHAAWHEALSSLEVKWPGDGPKLKKSACPESSELLSWGGFPENPAQFPFTHAPWFLSAFYLLRSTGDLSRARGLWTAELGLSVFAVVPVWMKFILAALRGNAP